MQIDTLQTIRQRLRVAQDWGEASRLFIAAAEIHCGRLEDHVGAGLVSADAALAEALTAETAAMSVRHRATLEHRRVSL